MPTESKKKKTDTEASGQIAAKGYAKEYFASGSIHFKHKVSLGGFGEQELPLTWADGMVGVMPVFETQEQAEAYAGENFPVVRFETA
jgi:hypothetical protein